jgi:hypothetical protein
LFSTMTRSFSSGTTSIIWVLYSDPAIPVHLFQ